MAWPFVVFGATTLSPLRFLPASWRECSRHTRSQSRRQPLSLQKWMRPEFFLALFQPIDASLAYAICFILLWLLLMWLLYRKRIFVKV